MKTLIFITLLSFFQVFAATNPVDYDIVYVRQLRMGDDTNTIWPEVAHPARLETGSDLMLLHPDGTEEILVDCMICSVTDPVISFDAQWVIYSLFHDMTQINTQRNLPKLGADIFRINLATREIQQLTHGKFTPNTGNGTWDESNPLDPTADYNKLGYGILNLGPMPLPDNKLVFTSNRNGYVPTKGLTNPTMQLYVMDIDGSNIHAIAPMSLSSVLHPTILNDGRIMFSTSETQGIRDYRLWGIWTINPDGTNWAPMVSAMTSPDAYHFMTQISSGEVIVEQYYNLNNNGFGALFALPASPPDASSPPFGSPQASLNSPIDYTGGFGPSTFKDSFTPQGYYAITPMTHPADYAAPLFDIGGDANGDRVGKFTHPSAAPENDMLVVYTPGPANDLNRPLTVPYYDAGIYVIDNSVPVWHPDELILVKNDPNYNEAWPRAVVPWSAIHGAAEPVKKSWLPNDGTVHTQLPAGTPYGLVGTSSFYKRDSFPGRGDSNFDGLDAFNTSQNDKSSNWLWQGADAGKYDNSDIWAVRIVAMEPIMDKRYGVDHAPYNHAGDFISHANEKLRILGEIPLRKFDNSGDPILDDEGNPDTSFLAKIPADTPFTFQTIDRNGMILNASQTWHQIRPGEMRADCGGCHAHSQMPLDFATTEAAKVNYDVIDLTISTPLVVKDLAGNNTIEEVQQTLVDVEFYQDIRPLLQTHCISCHNTTDNSGELVLDDTAIITDNKPGDYLRLAYDRSADYGYEPVIPNKRWRQTNASRYMRKFQSRRSLLIWKIFGQRLDGWSNEEHPTETIPGDATTLPEGTNTNTTDLDFIPSAAHPDGGMTQLTMKEKMTFARWIDLGAPLDISFTRGTNLGWHIDDVKPTLTISSPRQNLNTNPIDKIIFGLADANTGIDFSSLSIKADFTVNGQNPESELSSLVTNIGVGIYQIQLDNALEQDSIERHIKIEIYDNQGNVKRVDLRFLTSDLIFSNGFE